MLGATIASYTVRSKLGEGGMGTVYLAEHGVLGVRVAIKVLRSELSRDREIVTRFLNEARAASAIRHPAIVEILDFGVSADAGAYIVMEQLAGETLHARRHRLGRLDPARALVLVRQIAGGLAAAHERGVVHRDLKPENVFLVPDPEVVGGERIKLLDFGIAKLLGHGDASLTSTGTVLGTPTYMAPEQCRGSDAVDARADLYALGCVLHELVCGRPPFIADGAGDVIAHHLYFEPTPVRELDPTLPEGVERIVSWLLCKDPRDRPQSARALIDAIDTLEPGDARAPAPATTTLSRAAGESRRTLHTRTRWLVPFVTATTIVAGVAGFALWRGDRAHDEPAPIVIAARPAPQPVQLAIESDLRGAFAMLAGKVLELTADAPHEVVPARKHHAPAARPRPAFDPGDQGVNPFGP
jgi:serine/threonine protein kinase